MKDGAKKRSGFDLNPESWTKNFRGFLCPKRETNTLMRAA